MNPLRRTLARRSPVLLLTVCALLQLAGCKRKAVSEATAQRGTVLRLVGQGTDATNAAGLTGVTLEICDPHGAACTTASVGTPVPAGSVLRVGARGSAQVGLADGDVIEGQGRTVEINVAELKAFIAAAEADEPGRSADRAPGASPSDHLHRPAG